MARSEQGLKSRRDRDRKIKAELARNETPTDRQARLAYLRRYYRQNKSKYAEWRRANAAAVRKHKQGHYLRNSERLKANQRRNTFRKYGLTIESFEALNRAQDGLCAICRKPPDAPRLVVDHDHATGRVRGLLCRCCNTGLGLLRDDAMTLYAAIAYLAKSLKAR